MSVYIWDPPPQKKNPVFGGGGLPGSQITLKFKNYFLDTTEITIPDDKGPISFSSTIKPRDLAECVVKTDFVLMGWFNELY